MLRKFSPQHAAKKQLRLADLNATRSIQTPIKAKRPAASSEPIEYPVSPVEATVALKVLAAEPFSPESPAVSDFIEAESPRDRGED